MGKRIFSSALFLILFPFTAAADAGEWVELFDGKSTKGWTPRAEVTEFSAKDGELHLLSTNNVWVTSDRKMSDFEAEVEVLLPEDAVSAKLNSGFAFRCVGEEGKPKGYQCEIEGVVPGETGGVFGIGLGGWLYPGKGQKDEFLSRIEGVVKEGDWNHYRVVCQGKKITTFVNGKKIAELEDEQSLAGYFGIQHHGKGGLIRFRNIRARELPTPSPETAASTDRPNILWITAEDMSPTLGAYGDEYATTPNLDRLAKESVLYTNAFAASPVCSPSRACLITGMYPSSMGTNQMRSAYPVPRGVKGFPSFLRDAGYFTTNNVKTDYNNGDAERIIAESWNENSDTAHWRNRPKENSPPFFSVFNDMTSHQSRTMVWPYDSFVENVQSKLSAEEIHDPAKAPVPPYYPDTETVRKTVARFYDCVTVMDQNVGRLLQELEDDGLAEDTIVFFYSDHGSGMPRHKRLLHDSGMKVALMVRFPEKFQHLAPAEPGAKLDELVSFVDFPQTVLSLAGVEFPDYMQGGVFLGKDRGEPKEIVYGSRDRVDEVFEMSRSVRDKKYLYIRNYLPFRSWNQPSVFSDLGEIRRDITQYALENGEELTAAQRHYAGPDKPIEELYDCVADPHNVNNLLDGDLTDEEKAAYRKLIGLYHEKRAGIMDVGAIPEDIMAEYIEREDAPFRNVILGETNHKPDLALAWSAADLVGKGKKEELYAILERPEPEARFWGIIGLRTSFRDDPGVHKVVSIYLDDISPPVRIEAAGWLADASDDFREQALATLVAELENPAWWTALRACRSIELLGGKAESVVPVMKKLYARTRNAAGDENFFLAFSSGAFLDKMGEPTEAWDFTPKAGSFSADPPPKKEE